VLANKLREEKRKEKLSNKGDTNAGKDIR